MTSCSNDDARPVSEPKLPGHEFIEWVAVGGTCQEDHATQGGHYAGELVHWRDMATGISTRYGSVESLDATSVEAMTDEVQHPNRYHPPFSVDFRDIAASYFQSQAFVLHGVTDDLKHVAGYAATCNLSVTRRLDHLPSDKERKEWTAH